MPVRYKLSASILSADFTHLGQAIAQAEAGGADWIHVDVMDGHFVPNLTMGPVIVEACRRATRLPLDVHLMTEAPDRLIPDFARAGASILTVHVETCPHLHRTVELIKGLGVKAGVAINPATPASLLSEILGACDLVLAMSVNPGYSGQTLIESVLPKIQQIRGWVAQRGLATEVEIDGGIDVHTLPRAVRAGANVFVAATAVFRGGGSVTEATATLKKAIAESTAI